MSISKFFKVRENIFGDFIDNEEGQKILLLVKETYGRSLIDLEVI
jgi:hypothetical protein